MAASEEAAEKPKQMNTNRLFNHCPPKKGTVRVEIE